MNSEPIAIDSEYLKDIQDALKSNMDKQTKALLTKPEFKTFIRNTLREIGELDTYEEAKFQNIYREA